jgi:drug/metabolite transporter (DMT)-like permease
MLRSFDRPALLAAIIAPIAWGMTGMLFYQGYGLPTATIAAGRLLVAFGLLLPFAWLQCRDFWKSMRNPLAAAMGAYYVLATEAFARAPVVEVTLLVGTTPVLAIALGCSPLYPIV